MDNAQLLLIADQFAGANGLNGISACRILATAQVSPDYSAFARACRAEGVFTAEYLYNRARAFLGEYGLLAAGRCADSAC